jgi:hypothetical protein
MVELTKKPKEPFLIDRVITPFGKYVVISYTDKQYKGNGINFGGDFVFNMLSENLEKTLSRINDFAIAHPRIVVQEQKEIIASKLDLPSGTLEEILSPKNMENAAQIYQQRQIEYAEEITKKWKNVKHSVPTLEECRIIVETEFPLSIRDQLIKRTAQNYLAWNHARPPYTFTSEKEERGFVIVDSGVLSNCGYGVGEASFYKILSLGPEQENHETTFNRQTLEVKEILSSHIQPISGSALNEEKIAELQRRGTIINYDGWPTFLPDIKLTTNYLSGFHLGRVAASKGRRIL